MVDVFSRRVVGGSIERQAMNRPRKRGNSSLSRAEKNLSLVGDNPRFPILPRIEIPNLGSRIPALVQHRLPGDWTKHYNITPSNTGVVSNPCRNHSGTWALRP